MIKRVEKSQDISSLLNELHEKWPNAKFVETKADFCENERDGVPGQNIKMVFKLNLDPSYPSVIEFSHLFSIDATHIRIMLNQKGALPRLGQKDDMEAFFKNNFFGIKNALRAYNGKNDNYDAIVDSMIKAIGQTFGNGFGL